MRTEVVEFYKEKKQIIHRIFDRRPKKEIPVEMVQRGMERVYDRIQAGERIEDIRVTHEAWVEAAKLYDAKWVHDNQNNPGPYYPTTAKDAKEHIDYLHAKHTNEKAILNSLYENERNAHKKEHDRAELFKAVFLNLVALGSAGAILAILLKGV
ncbi:MAG: hypothetical protein ACW99J_16160 [Candidatus Thorarchaeota archaeon]|jgi:hypothetical protein